MEIDQIKRAVSLYKDSINTKGYIKPARYSAEEMANHFGRYPHILWMCEEILNDRVAGEKAHRWLGFIQGMLFDDGMYTIGQLKDHNR